MALYTDSSVFGIEELQAHETGILDVAHAEGIDLSVKIALAREEVGLQILSALRRLTETESAGISLNTVVVTSPLRLWQIFHTLAITYRDAYNNQLNDRYKGKWQEYRELARWAAGLLLQIGLGVVVDPVPEAEAPQLTAAPGGLAEGKYFVRVAWLNASGEEGVAGQLASSTVVSGNTIQVQAVNPPANAVAWNAYVGRSPHDLFRQNGSPVTAGGSFMVASLVLTGARPGTGQEPDLFRQVPRVFPRG